MSSILKIQFPSDFEKRYRKYKAAFETENVESSVLDQKVMEELQIDVSSTRKNSDNAEPARKKALMGRAKTVSKFIEKLVCVRPKQQSRKYKIVVNDDYAKPIEVDRSPNSTWDYLFRVAEGEELAAGDRKAALDYLNSNKQSRLYTQTGLELTKILKTDNHVIVSNIKMEVIDETTFARRANAQTA
jgi:hypothetical protein